MKRFFKIPAFAIGFAVISVFILIAIPGYLIAPDSSEDCNDIIPQVANQKPGYRFAYVRTVNGQSQAAGFFQKWWSGESNPGSAIPVIRIVSEGKDSVAAISTLNTRLSFDRKLLQSHQAAAGESRYLFHRTFYLGSDRFGRDVLSRLMIGARVSLVAGLVSVVISLIIGLLIGLFAGYSRGFADHALSWLISVFWSVPTLLIALGLSFVFGKGLIQVLIAIGLSTWVEVARVVRGQTMQLREKEFVLAARITGFSTFRILFRHILPNLKGSLTVLATSNFAAAILLEAGLSFLGLGIAPPSPSWGIMVSEHRGNLVLDTAWLAIIPGAAIMILVMGFNLMTMGIRDALDSRIQTTT